MSRKADSDWKMSPSSPLYALIIVVAVVGLVAAAGFGLVRLIVAIV